MGVEVAVAAAVFGASKAYEITEQRKAADAADRASQENLGFQQRKYATERQQADVSNIRDMRKSIRASRLAAATMTNTAANKGGMGGSGLAGGLSAIGAQTAGNLNDMVGRAQTNASISQDMLATSGRVGALETYGRQSQSNAALGGMVSGMAGTIFSAVGGPAAVAGGVNTAISNYQFDSDWEAGMNAYKKA
jgi:hypothetical protein